MIGFISATLINPFDSWQLPISPIRCCLSYSFITLDSINATRCKKLRTGCSITFAYLSIPGHHWIYLLLLLVGNCHHHHWPPFSTLTIAYLLLLLSWVTCYCWYQYHFFFIWIPIPFWSHQLQITTVI